MSDALRFNLFPKQREFIDCTGNIARQLLYHGGTGSSKSHSLIVKLFLRASHPGACEGLARKINADIPNSFLKDWKRLIPAGLYTHRVNQQVIEIKGGGQIEMFGCDDIERIGSRNLTGCAIEECNQLSENDWQKIDSVVRVEHPLGNQLYGVCNPDGTTHWLYEYFQIDRPQCPPNRKHIPTIVEDGYLGKNPAYVEAMKSKTGIDRQRRYLGLWCDAAGAIFDNFSDMNICTRKIDGTQVLGIDDGDSLPFVVLRFFCDGDRLHIAEEFYKKNVRSLDAKTEIVQRMDKGGLKAVVVDSQAQHVIEALWKVGLPACKSEKGNGSVEAGVSKIATMLGAYASDGKPRLTIDPSCTNTIREFRSWSYAPSGEYGKHNNHSIDAIRYVVKFFNLGASTLSDANAASESAQAEEPAWARDDRGFNWESQSVDTFGASAWA